MSKPLDYELREKTSRQLCNEIHHDVRMMKITAAILFVLGFILGALVF